MNLDKSVVKVHLKKIPLGFLFRSFLECGWAVLVAM